ncbi:glycoside hydrolase family 5 protein [Rhodopseudomonas sp. HC1]|uniref:glycoside hydrolase family 5 protein n=1 Tax=Rhodopseudomonas infernalis TaxID=2897386 RepID=UPI001EE90ECE|nr:cellulase family glycosylhydrolase [Rhodopseudomonas infernalis]MCG6203121.1 glycoside hydrolase family 5 protein [Rhodopseudomonas infernalis]
MRFAIAAVLLVAWVAGAQATPFHKGASLQIYTFPALRDGRYEDDPYPARTDAFAHFQIAQLRSLGLDHVRLPVDVGPLLDDPDGQQWRQFRLPFVTLVQQLHRAGLGTIVTLVAPSRAGGIPEDQLDGLGGPRFSRYAALAEQFAAELSNLHFDALALEPMNEPQQMCVRTGDVDWTVYQDVLVDRLRGKAPLLWLGLTGGCWSKIEGLSHLKSESLQRPKTFISVHFYDPFLFTHQGSDWTLDIMPLISGLPYPVRPDIRDDEVARVRARAATKARDRLASEQLLASANAAIDQYFRHDGKTDSIQRKLAELDAWCRRNKVTPERIIFTEFGATRSGVDRDDRVNWLRDVSNAIESHGWAWTLWVLRDGPFGLDDAHGQLDPALLRSVGLASP